MAGSFAFGLAADRSSRTTDASQSRLEMRIRHCGNKCWRSSLESLTGGFPSQDPDCQSWRDCTSSASCVPRARHLAGGRLFRCGSRRIACAARGRGVPAGTGAVGRLLPAGRPHPRDRAQVRRGRDTSRATDFFPRMRSSRKRARRRGLRSSGRRRRLCANWDRRRGRVLRPIARRCRAPRARCAASPLPKRR